MRALFTLLPARGSLQPLLPVAEAMRARGHQVALCSSPRLRNEVEAHGLAFLPAGLDWHVSDPDYIGVLCQAAGGLAFPPLAGEERFAWVIANLFIGAAARRMLPELIGVARQWSADLIVRESLEFAGCVAAEALGLPHASVAAAADSALDRRRELAGPLTGLRQQAGLPADPDGDMAFRYLHLCFTPPGFDGPGARFPPTARFFAHHSTPTPHEDLPPWLDHLAERPTVLVSMGTVFHRTPGLHETILAALRDEPVNLLIALGFDQDPVAPGAAAAARAGPAHASPGGAAATVRAAGVPRRLQQRQRSTRRGRSAGHRAGRRRSALLRQALPGPRGWPRYRASRAQRRGDPRSRADGAGRSLLPRAGTAHARRSLCAPAGRRRRYRARAGRR